MTEQENIELYTTVHLHPSERSPLECHYGFFIADMPGYGGAQCFSWFETEADAIKHLSEEQAMLYSPEDKSDDDDEEGEHVLLTQLQTALTGVTTLKAVPRERINEIGAGMFELRWVGSLFDLEGGNEPFEKEIQADFRENVFGEERGLGPNESDLEDFEVHLLNYNG